MTASEGIKPSPDTARDDVQSVNSLDVKDCNDTGEPRLPRNVQAVYLRPLRRHARFGIPSCDLQLRSYNVRNVEFFSDFALRAAYFLDLPASGPVPLPRITERWTMPRSNFVHKKSQENFERITLRRLIQIQDGHPDTVKIWLAFLRKNAYYGVGMKANIWESDKLGRLSWILYWSGLMRLKDVGRSMDSNLEKSRDDIDSLWAHFGRDNSIGKTVDNEKLMNIERRQRLDNGPLMT